MKNYVFSFDAAEAQLIVDGLSQLPYFKVSQLIAKVYEQVRDQVKVPASGATVDQSSNEQPLERSDGM